MMTEEQLKLIKHAAEEILWYCNHMPISGAVVDHAKEIISIANVWDEKGTV